MPLIAPASDQILSLCTGTGALDMAVMRLTGAQLAYVAEKEPAPAKILAHHYPTTPNLADITLIDWSQLMGQVDIITAGFPCQNISNAGDREGINGSKSGIWANVADAIRIIRPRIIFLENVAAIRTRGLGRVIGDLAGCGYDARWTSVRASTAAGASHERYRWFCEATPNAEGIRRTARRSESEGQQGALRPSGCGGALATAANGVRREGWGWHEPGEKRRDEPSDCRYSPAVWWGDYLPAIRRWERLTGQPAPMPTEIGPRGGRRLTAEFPEWMMGLPRGWITEVPGLTRNEKIEAAGNGVVWQQAYEAYRSLIWQQQNA